MAGGAATAQDSSQVFPMVILLSLAVLIPMKRLNLEEKPDFVFSFSFVINYVVMSPICYLIY
jgi:hypothetical protein